MRAATRRSTLARAQTRIVADLLQRAVADRAQSTVPDLLQSGVPDRPQSGTRIDSVDEVLVDTVGDRRPDAQIWELGRGVFVKEVQAAVLDGRADIAVHSAKDLPSTSPEGLVIAAVPPRDDPRDALVGATLESLPVGGRVGTGSVRRRAQLAWLRPDLTYGPLRGNIETRLEKAAGFDAIVVAAAALRRLGRARLATELLDSRIMVPQVGQGALAVECRADDERTRSLLAAIDDPASRAAVETERAYLRELGGGCDVPVGALANVDFGRPAGSTIRLTAVLATGEGRILLRYAGQGDDPEQLGRGVASQLIERGGGSVVLADTDPTVDMADPMP